MEFEILNDILTSTISNIFPNRKKHIKLLKSHDKSLFLGDSSSQTKMINNNSNSNKQYRITKIHINVGDLEEWKKSEAKKILHDAMKRLNLVKEKIKNKNMAELGMELLLSEKSKVKKELKNYDDIFLQTFKRMPENNDKECIRPLYIYYKNIKNGICQIQPSNSKDLHEKNLFSFGSPSSNDTASDTHDSNNTSRPAGEITNEKKEISSQDQDTSLDSNVNSTNEPITLTQSIVLYKLEEEHRKIKQEQVELELKIISYQKEFFNINQRKVLYQKDMIPVQNEIKKYKENKQQIKNLEEIISKQRAFI